MTFVVTGAATSTPDRKNRIQAVPAGGIPSTPTWLPGIEMRVVARASACKLVMDVA